MSVKPSRKYRRLNSFFVLLIIAPILFSGCSHFFEGAQIKSSLSEADDLFIRGNYNASLKRYERILKDYPDAGDKALFEMGTIYAYTWNQQKDYRQSVKCFQKLMNDYPKSQFRLQAEVMISLIHNISNRDQKMENQKAQIEMMGREAIGKDHELMALQKKIEALEQEVFLYRNGPADYVLIEKKDRRLTLIAKGKVLKTYRIALGGNPDGPKEKQGDLKTPEGLYMIDSRNRNSGFHLALRISYPNGKDKKKARELGVSPGGDIMIHGIKKGFGWIGNDHTGIDWTQGCIAVTDEEIEEIDKLVADGTKVEIRP